MTSEANSKKPSERALRELTRRLESGELREASRLPPERQLAAELAVSRRALREALGRLEAEGRIWRGVGKGTIVGRTPPKAKRTAIKGLTSPTDLMEARLALEPSIAALAAIHATTQDLEEMHRCLKKSIGVSEHEGWEQWDGALHRAIGRAAHNELIVALFDLLNSARTHTEWGQLRKASLTTDRQHLYTRQHRAILSAIANRDAQEARSCMHRHLLTVKQTLFSPWEERMDVKNHLDESEHAR